MEVEYQMQQEGGKESALLKRGHISLEQRQHGCQGWKHCPLEAVPKPTLCQVMHTKNNQAHAYTARSPRWEKPKPSLHGPVTSSAWDLSLGSPSSSTATRCLSPAHFALQAANSRIDCNYDWIKDLFSSI